MSSDIIQQLEAYKAAQPAMASATTDMSGFTESNSTEPQHGDPVPSWTLHIHEVRLVCPKCRNACVIPYRGYYANERPHYEHCGCGQSFNITWQDKIKDAIVTIHIHADEDVSPDDDDE